MTSPVEVLCHLALFKKPSASTRRSLVADSPMHAATLEAIAIAAGWLSRCFQADRGRLLFYHDRVLDARIAKLGRSIDAAMMVSTYEANVSPVKAYHPMQAQSPPTLSSVSR